MKAYRKDIWRSIMKEKKRFFSILLITVLGVTMLTGIKAACQDLRYSADQFFDQQDLFDIRVVSTLGLTNDDLEGLKKIEGVQRVEGDYSEISYVQEGDKKSSVELKTIKENGINRPYLLEGKLPQKEDEIVVTKKYLSKTGKAIGDTIIMEDINPTTYTITGVVIDAMDINSDEGAAAFRSTATTDYTFFVLEEAIDHQIYSAIDLILEEGKEFNTFSKEYENYVGQVIKTIESQLKGEREQARYEEMITQAQAQLSQLSKQEQVSDEMIKMPRWYVQDRSSLSGYSNIQTDAECIETIGTVFPIIFFVVAVLISLTTITRRVEEERGLIGTYKSLGFSNREIQRKYLVYALAACIFGGIIGNIFGFIVLPSIIFIVFGVMYQLPEYQLQFNAIYGLGGVLLFTLGIVVATILSCRHELKQMPATLIRPKAPRIGSRVILEHIKPVWKRLSFLNKVTARNLFRYKKRLFMTISGIMGCTALVLCGFVIKDSVTELLPLQYERTYQYDLMSVAKTEENNKFLSYLFEDDRIDDFINIQIDSVTIMNEDKDEIKVQLFVVPEGQSLETYINLESTNDKKITLEDDGILVTQNAGKVLGFGADDYVYLQTLNLEQAKVNVVDLVKNYLGNTVYMTQRTYENLFGEFLPNGVLINLKDHIDSVQYADELGKREGVISVVSTESLKEEFSTAFSLINMVVYILIILAAGLAFTVLFTLSTTNISERERELATIKVLGFYDREVHSYVNKETLILTGIGILLGLPLGTLLGNGLTLVLKMPSIHFAVSIYPISYVISVVVSFFFAFAVNLMTNRSLDEIEPVEALKSVE